MKNQTSILTFWKLKSLPGITCTLLLLGNSVWGQSAHQVIPDSLPLEKLMGYSQTIRYSIGHQERAAFIARLMENAEVFFQKEVGFTPKTELYILAPGDWKSVAAKPLHDVYGFPHNLDQVRLVIAAEDNDFWRSFIPPVDTLPASLASQFKTAYAKPDGTYTMMPFFDLLALHEMGHSYTAQAGLKMHRHWMGELFVNIMLHTYVAEKKPELLPALEAFPNLIINAGTAEYSYTSLHDFEKLYATLGMGPRNYGWYQSRFHGSAKAIYDAGGKQVLKKLWNALRQHQQEMSDESFAEMLKMDVHPSVADVYLKWNTTP
ncbi:hypothetical protein [Arundinibacter roseus]|uniref:DUF1570 domain-containing protein n=1 Tax=Arundinibacter roseus TaxID=2070510 RepID=A0A4V2XAI2_9BACT|nr:hypothetical protein [Arundinibacter roseus]TDB67475.1 hypothetical protein EZE20_05880 [Arundinibacter roseus]